jgi:hypothetical protein
MLVRVLFLMSRSASVAAPQRKQQLGRACGLHTHPHLFRDQRMPAIMAYSRSTSFDFLHPPDAAPYDEARRAALDRLDLLANLFDTAFVVPGTGVRFGVEGLLRLVPGIGDVVASALSC